MSFRARVTSSFALIVVVPMAAIAILVFTVIDNGQSSRSEARVNGIAGVAADVYLDASTRASRTATALGGRIALTRVARLGPEVRRLAPGYGAVRVTVRVGSTPRVDTATAAGAIAPGLALVTAAGRPPRTVVVSLLTAAEYARELSGHGISVVVRSAGRPLASTLGSADELSLPSSGRITIGSTGYQVVSRTFAGFDSVPVRVSVLSSLAGAGGSAGGDRILAIALIGGFLLLAFLFTVLSSRAFHTQLTIFLDAARRLGSGDLSTSVPVSGRDEFALLGQEFNNMSRQLARRVSELEQERSRVRKAIRRIGEAFASGLDREALLELALKTAMDATDADRGRVSARATTVDPLAETLHVGRLAGLEGPIHEAERRALAGDGVGEASVDDVHLATVALGAIVPGGPAHGLITVCRPERRFTDDDIELLRSLAARATLALANVNLHFDIKRQAVTDDLTGLATHGHFQELLSAVMDEVRRYHYPVGLIMLDIDDFKSVNDVYGHQQGDLVLRYVADSLRETSRDVDVAARYGGEELTLILPHTDLEGAFEMAERARAAIEKLSVPLLDGTGSVSITASVGAASSADGDKNDLINAADAALYTAKREGKNRTVKAAAEPANVGTGE